MKTHCNLLSLLNFIWWVDVNEWEMYVGYSNPTEIVYQVAAGFHSVYHQFIDGEENKQDAWTSRMLMSNSCSPCRPILSHNVSCDFMPHESEIFCIHVKVRSSPSVCHTIISKLILNAHINQVIALSHCLPIGWMPKQHVHPMCMSTLMDV